jgi:ABC-2 type transport system ATP-binding protein
VKEDFKDFNVCYFSKLGKVIKIVIKGNKDEVVSKLNKMHPIFLDVIPLNFEEMFVYEVEEKGYIDHENK